MKISLIIEVPDETIAVYRDHIRNEDEKNIKFDLKSKREILLLIKDMIEEQMSWDVESIDLTE